MATQIGPRISADAPCHREERIQRTHDVLCRAATCDGSERSALLNQAITLNLPVARSIAQRFRNRGESVEDLEQVAYLALTRAVHAFDASRGGDFLAYAVPTIRGELKRHFRDLGWMVRPPRRIQEIQAVVVPAIEELTQELGRSPRIAEIARRVARTEDEVGEALACSGCFTPDSLDDRGPDGDGRPVSARLGEAEPGFERAEAVTVLGPACRDLKPRDRRILFLRFFLGRTQQEIAEELGVTQMQVSRLLSRILRNLRESLSDGPAADPSADPFADPSADPSDGRPKVAA